MNVENLRSRVSISGLALMLVGLGLVLLESQTDFLRRKLGLPGHIVILFCGTAFSVWGLKEMVARFWPRLGRRGHYFQLPREGLAYLTIMFFLFIGSIMAQSNLLLMVFCLMAGSFIINGWLTFTMLRNSRMSRDLPQRIMAGETCVVTLTLENRNKWISAWLMTMSDSISHTSGSMHPEVLFVRVPPQKRRSGSYQLSPSSRGRYVFSQLDVVTRFPLGMVERGVAREAHYELLVYPRLGHLHAGWRRMLQNSTELVSNARPNNGTFQDDLHRIREFRPGDDRRMIHWRTSARMNELMVCEYQECRDRDLVVIFDAWTPESPTVDEEEQMERGLRFAATICMSYLRNSRQSSLTVKLVGRELVQWFGDSGEYHTDELLDAFALLEASHLPDIEVLIECLGQRRLTQQRTILISPRADMLRDELARLPAVSTVDLQIFGTTPEELSGVFEDAEESPVGASNGNANALVSMR